MIEGRVFLVGAGPGDPELLTRKAWRVLQAADVVLHDDLVSGEILALLPKSARIVNVGKRCGEQHISQNELNERMVKLARAGQMVVRLKNGDPMLFGRAGEEIAALREAGIEFEVVPGITAALGAAASARIPLTDRRLASRVVFITAHRASGKNPELAAPAEGDGTTYVIYMPGRRYADLVAELETLGVAPETPCLLVSHATQPNETIYHTAVEHLARSPIAASPSLLIVGRVTAAFRTENRGADRKQGWSAEILNFVLQHPIQES